MLPRTPSSSPAAFASAVSGATPMAVFQQNLHAGSVFGKTGNGGVQQQPDAVLSHLRMDKGGHVAVKGGQQLAAHFHNGDLQPQLPQVFR